MSKIVDFDEFTFHYVSIKSKSDSNTRLFSSTFTFHYVSIKSLCEVNIIALA